MMRRCRGGPHMFVTKFEESVLPRIVLPLLAGLLLAAANQNAHAASALATRAIYVISEYEGYGIVDCLTQKRECGRLVADSWCEAHGHGPALAFGRADDITSSSGTRALPASTNAGAAIVTCSD